MAVIVVVLVVLFFGALWLWDRRTRKKGHTLRSSSDMWRSERDVHRNLRESSTLWNGPIDRDWSKPDDQRYAGPSAD